MTFEKRERERESAREHERSRKFQRYSNNYVKSILSYEINLSCELNLLHEINKFSSEMTFEKREQG